MKTSRHITILAGIFALLAVASCAHTGTPPASSLRTIESADDLDESAMARNPSPLLIDLRDRADYIEGHIPGFINLPYGTDGALLGQWIDPYPRNKPVILICYGGNRSARAFQRLVIAGFTNVSDFTPGYNGYLTQKGGEFIEETGSCDCPEQVIE